MSCLSLGLMKNVCLWKISRRAIQISHSFKFGETNSLRNRRNFDAEKMEMKSAIRTRESVFSIEKVVEVLKQEAVLDLCVIKVPPERRYVEYFVICSPRNDSQLISVPAALSAMYKEVFGERKYVEGLGDGTKPPEWTVIDLGNIVVHTMNEDVRELYNLENLWLFGPEFDQQNMEFTDQIKENVFNEINEEKQKRQDDWAFFQ